MFRIMTRIISVASLLVAISVFATGINGKHQGQTSIATTGRIIKINAQARTMMVRSSEDPGVPNVPAEETSRQRLGVKMTGILVPGGITIALPGTTVTAPRPEPTSDVANGLNAYTVVTTSRTVFEDGADSINFDDFTNGETISIHGLFKGTILIASRLAKWN